ncbi:type II and III secretion system protein (plasmid) [Allomeiothermus silvanus DSM 9946]|uniref:Type II and III secretion system protein n=1 Tax=Allomeiothermus silvanus (strain ATCC 700542 / DSM 9946 / NBRC 106475 / NCIMB 13440 / VI-R2) TaxID=526227 RepID=D7BJM4_ALLS1|nr:secretin N-terminal domain-containing protein [Allomeiothermus silvanus]ADH65380.1 type II and III secretion system protein [Allomeiothermus silvanus DSM 9946]
MVALVLALSLALAAGSLPPGKAYDTPINVEVKAGISLGDAIRIIARSAGLSVVVAQSPEVQAQVTLDVKGKPFRQVWEGLFMGAASSLDYRVLSSGLIVVAPRSQIEAFARSKAPQAPAAAPTGDRPAGSPAQPVPTGDRPAGERSQSVPTGDRPSGEPAQPAPAPTPPKQVRIYPAEDPTTLANLLSSLLPEARAYALSAPKAVVVQASEADQATVQGLLAALAEQSKQDSPAPPAPPQPSTPPSPPSTPPQEEPQEAVLFPAAEGGQALAQAVALRFKEAKVNFLEPLRVLLVQLPTSQTAKLKEFVGQLLATRPPEPKPVEKPQEKPVERSLPLGYAKATTVIDLVGKLLPESKEVALAADERTNTVLLRGPQAAVAAIERLVGDLDRPIPQVDLQVRVEQLSSSNGDEIGAALEAALGPLSLKADPGSGQYGLGLEVGKTGLLKLNAALKALQSAGKGRSLIDSRFTVSSGESVNLLSGGSLLIPLTSTGTGGSSGGTSTTGLQNVEFGLELKLTPTVIPGDKIQLGVNINLGSAPTVGPNNSTLVPKQQLTSNVLLSSGNSAVLGGVISVEEKESRSGIPVLMDLPLIGGLFSQTVKSSSQTHLLIVVTAVSRLPEAVKPASMPQAAPPAPAPAQPPKPQPQAAPAAPPPPPVGFERNVQVGGQR